jgi:hypothetical protein
VRGVRKELSLPRNGASMRSRRSLRVPEAGQFVAATLIDWQPLTGVGSGPLGGSAIGLGVEGGARGAVTDEGGCDEGEEIANGQPEHEFAQCLVVLATADHSCRRTERLRDHEVLRPPVESA